MRLLFLPALVLLSLPAKAAPTCAIDIDAMEARLAALEAAHPLVLSDISCDMPILPAHILMCDAAEARDDSLWRMGRLDDLAWVHAVENATGQDIDDTSPPLDESFIAARDACSDTACLCAVLIDHTNASLGGTSPYPN